MPSAREVFELAVNVRFKRVDDLAEVWCQWAEMEIRQGNFDAALGLMGRATAAPRRKGLQLSSVRYTDESLAPQVCHASAHVPGTAVQVSQALVLLRRPGGEYRYSGEHGYSV